MNKYDFSGFSGYFPEWNYSLLSIILIIISLGFIIICEIYLIYYVIYYYLIEFRNRKKNCENNGFKKS